MMNPITCYFKFIIPTYDRSSVEQAKQSILNQTFKDVHVVVVHDGHDDGFFSLDYFSDDYPEDQYSDIYLSYRRWNGGTRNAGIRYPNVKSKYTMFLDDDDILTNYSVLERLYHFIQENNEPDLVRLPYERYEVNANKSSINYLSKDTDVPSVCMSGKTAPWTKCIKTDLIVPFPENTTHEDVVQHMLQCDHCISCAHFDEPVVRWNIYDGQTSKGKNPKWNSSRYRFIADLMDLKLHHIWACETRDRKIQLALEALWKTN